MNNILLWRRTAITLYVSHNHTLRMFNDYLMVMFGLKVEQSKLKLWVVSRVINVNIYNNCICKKEAFFYSGH